MLWSNSTIRTRKQKNRALRHAVSLKRLEIIELVVLLIPTPFSLRDDPDASIVNESD
jgi:hypothetical protein